MNNDDQPPCQKDCCDGVLELRLEIDRLKHVTTQQYQLITKLREEVETLEKDRDYWWSNSAEWELDYYTVLHENERLTAIIAQKGSDEDRA